MFRRTGRRRIGGRQQRLESVLRLRRTTLSCGAVGCGALFLGVMGGWAGAMWSLAIGSGAGPGALYGGLGAFALGIVMIPLNNRIGTTLPLGCISIALLLFLMLLGTLFWMIGALVH
jgi:hypothetical protein